MNLRFSIALILISGEFCFAQQERTPRLNASVEIISGILAYSGLVNNENKYSINYTFEGSISQNLEFGKLSLGLVFRTNNFSETHSAHGQEIINEVHSDLRGLSLVFSYFIKRKIKSCFTPSLGILPIAIRNYRATSLIGGNLVSETLSPESGYGSAMLIRMGFDYQYKIHAHWSIFSGVTLDLNLKPDEYSPPKLPQYWYPKDEKISSLNLHFGITWYIATQ